MRASGFGTTIQIVRASSLQPISPGRWLGDRGVHRYGGLLVAVLLSGQGLVACGDCESTARDWRSLTDRKDVVACTADSQCILVGQSSTCDCSESMTPNGVAVNGAAYRAAGGETMLENFYRSCRGHMSRCCDCAPWSATGCVNGQCAIVRYGCCGCPPDGGRPWTPADAAASPLVDAAVDVPEPAYDSN